ncbi:sensor histidine kinase [Haloimpatiens sp. FM7315]|uniref:sensor histidine kinase n=1 Tax=Haloimpatiens sp. FM7315 TaxID=3298609 RepID=UPI0035A3CA76
MKILANGKIKKLFSVNLVIIITFTLISGVFAYLNFKNSAFYVLICSLCISISIIKTSFDYFKEQNQIMEDAARQIKDYISGKENSRIECNDEGELYRLFHEVNSLVAILNAHVVSEANSKEFLKDTISDISHQLKTPLAALNIYNGIMEEDIENPKTIKEFTKLSEEELDRIEILVQNLLKITKLDAGTIMIEKTLENVSDMMHCIERHFAYRAKNENKKLYMSGNDSINLFCDRNWLIEALSNIVKNAFDHTKEEDYISAKWREFASVTQIIIKDNGTGIHEEDLNHIFKRFYRSRFSKDTKGIGLGLALSKAIIEEHSGTIQVDSELGSGTTFTINLLIPTKL